MGNGEWGIEEPLYPTPHPNSLFPIPNSQFPIPNSQFPIPYSLFPIPHSLPKKTEPPMWYFSWILGLGLACAFAILNAMWFELHADDEARRKADERIPPH